MSLVWKVTIGKVTFGQNDEQRKSQLYWQTNALHNSFTIVVSSTKKYVATFVATRATKLEEFLQNELFFVWPILWIYTISSKSEREMQLNLAKYSLCYTLGDCITKVSCSPWLLPTCMNTYLLRYVCLFRIYLNISSTKMNESISVQVFRNKSFL
jgi:hypothetical protein